MIIVGILRSLCSLYYMSNAERRIPVQYAKRVVGRKMYGGQSTHLPIKVNASGVMPIIFASSILVAAADRFDVLAAGELATVGAHILNLFSQSSVVLHRSVRAADPRISHTSMHPSSSTRSRSPTT